MYKGLKNTQNLMSKVYLYGLTIKMALKDVPC